MSEKGLSGLWFDKSKKWELVELPVYEPGDDEIAVSYTHLRAHETKANIVLRLLR